MRFPEKNYEGDTHATKNVQADNVVHNGGQGNDSEKWLPEWLPGATEWLPEWLPIPIHPGDKISVPSHKRGPK